MNYSLIALNIAPYYSSYIALSALIGSINYSTKTLTVHTGKLGTPTKHWTLIKNRHATRDVKKNRVWINRRAKKLYKDLLSIILTSCFPLLAVILTSLTHDDALGLSVALPYLFALLNEVA